MTTPTTTSTLRLTGSVKWFNNKAGFGFITVCDEGEYKGKDIFAHYSSLRINPDKYKYLVQGEYVEFNLSTASKDSHEYQAVDVTGIKGGPTMCETRHLARLSEPSHEDGEKEPHEGAVPRAPPVRPPSTVHRPARQGPRGERPPTDGFISVEKKSTRRRATKTA